MNFFPVNFCSVLLFDYIESMAIFTAGQKFILINIICTMRVAGLSEVFVQQNFLAIQYVIYVCICITKSTLAVRVCNRLGQHSCILTSLVLVKIILVVV